MNATITDHPSADTLIRFGQGRLEPAEAAVIESHLMSCQECGAILQSAPDDTLIQLARAAQQQTVGVAHPGEQTVPTKSGDTIPMQLLDHPRYHVTGLLGTGGMGAVYKAEHRMMQRTVALKVIRHNIIASRAALERFEREVRAAAKLSHPNIVAAYDAEEAGGLHFLVMEYVDGISLDKLIERRGPLAPHEAAQLIRQAAAGLAHAHQQSMVHRDIKPQNLMVTRKGQLKILDFGLARLATAATEESIASDLPAKDQPIAAGATRAGMVLGTPDYIAPEQVANASAADIRSDLYALGCTLYYLLTGTPPFAGGSMLDKLSSHLSKTPPPLADRRNDLPPDLIAIVDRLLAKDPAYRFQTPSDLATAITPLAKQKVLDSSGKTAVVQPTSMALDLANLMPPLVETKPMSIAKTSSDSNSFAVVAIAIAALFALMIVGVVVVGGLGYSYTSLDRVENPSPVPTPIQQGIAAAPIAGSASTDNTSEDSTTDLPNTATPDASTANASAPPETSPGIAASEAFARENPDDASPASASNTGAGAAATEVPKNVLVVLPRFGLWYGDYGPLATQLRRDGYKVTVASTELGSSELLESSPGEPVPIDLVIGPKIDPKDYAAIVFAGYNVASMCDGADAKTTRALIESFNRNKKPLVGICGGQRVLAHHGWLQGRRVSHSPIAGQDPQYDLCEAKLDKSAAVVVDGPILTGRDDKAAAELAQRLVQYLADQQK